MICFTCKSPMEKAEGAPRPDEHLECFKLRTATLTLVSIPPSSDSKITGWSFEMEMPKE